jgi:PmbA protein
MMTIQNRELTKYVLNQLQFLGVDHGQVSMDTQKKYEFNIERGKISLLRTVESNQLNLHSIKNRRQGKISTNHLTTDSINQTCKDLLEQTLSSPKDQFYKIADKEENRDLKFNVGTPDYDLIHEKIETFLKDVKVDYPKIILEQAAVIYIDTEKTVLNSNGVHHQIHQGHFDFWGMFTAKDGEKTSSFNYSSVSMNHLNQELLEVGTFKTLFKQSLEQLDQKSLNQKFKGDIIISPDCLQEFLYDLTLPLYDHQMLDGTSILKGKIGRQVAHGDFTFTMSPRNTDLVPGLLNTDGYITENETVFKNGVLKNYLLSDYAANKLGLKRNRSGASHYIVNAGKNRLKELIGSIEKGILLNRFSGGYPSVAGDFSGVAKNSYYIENGEIIAPIKEVMVSGSIFEAFKNIKGISQERVNFGTSLLPWIHSKGMTIS